MLSPLFDEAVSKIKAASSIFILHDYDADGIGAALITQRAAQNINPNATIDLFALKNKVVLPEATPLKDHDLIIVLDFDLANYGVLDAYKAINSNIITIDHHIPKTSKSTELRINPHDHHHPLGSKYNTGALVYEGFSAHLNQDDTDWIAAATIVGDYTFDDHAETLSTIAEKYNIDIPMRGLDWHNSVFANFVIYCECAAAVSIEAIRDLTHKLQDVKTLKDFTNFPNPYPEPQDDALRYIKNYKSMATVDVENQIIWLRIESQYAITSWVANNISFDNPNMLYLISEKEKKIFKVSARSQAPLVSCAELLNQATKNIPGGLGGGHPQAAGAAVPIDQWKAFEKNVYAFLGDDEASED